MSDPRHFDPADEDLRGVGRLVAPGTTVRRVVLVPALPMLGPLCACGCGEHIGARMSFVRFVDKTHQLRDARRRRYARQRQNAESPTPAREPGVAIRR